MAAIGRIKGHLKESAFTRRSSIHGCSWLVPDPKPEIGHISAFLQQAAHGQALAPSKFIELASLPY
jgi:hypothetical protein